jgi:hypothetical protein
MWSIAVSFIEEEIASDGLAYAVRWNLGMVVIDQNWY